MPRHGSVIYLEDVSVTFDGFQALRGVNLFIDRGELRALIGPNGAGKTTLLDVICGQVKPEKGRVIFGDKTDLSALEPYQIAALGIGRKFQTPTVFKHLTLFENLTLSLPRRCDLWSTLFNAPTAAQRDKIAAILETLGLVEKADRKAGLLSHGETQWLEIGMVMAQEPALLLLDEPVAGMTGKEREKTSQLLRRMAQDQAVLVVEHDMEFVRQTAQKVTVLHEGAILCEGSVDRVQQDPRVIEVYLGRGYRADALDSGAQRRLRRQPDPVGRSSTRP
ncbi:MAG TPA: urea ABC transporter ATP-binding protein UrtD [Candidatus Tectomicrobia bacterium]|nr:urea ABC transporter ATP-binding protein UrtD [Candidatus Tectomicrobia bacterium]